jgi:hypothetical protein
LKDEHRGILESAAVLTWAESDNADYIVAWEKGKIIHQLFKTFTGSKAGGVAAEKERFLAQCRTETQQNIAQHLKVHPDATPIQLKIMLATEVAAFKAKIAPHCSGSGKNNCSTPADCKGSRSDQRHAARQAVRNARKATKPTRASSVGAREWGRSPPKTMDGEQSPSAPPTSTVAGLDASTVPLVTHTVALAPAVTPVAVAVDHQPARREPGTFASRATSPPPAVPTNTPAKSPSFETRPPRAASGREDAAEDAGRTTLHGLPKRSASGRVLPTPPKPKGLPSVRDGKRSNNGDTA